MQQVRTDLALEARESVTEGKTGDSGGFGGRGGSQRVRCSRHKSRGTE